MCVCVYERETERDRETERERQREEEEEEEEEENGPSFAGAWLHQTPPLTSPGILKKQLDTRITFQMQLLSADSGTVYGH